MDHVFDEAAHVLSSSLTRRAAFRKLGSLLGGALLIALVPRLASAAPPCGTSIQTINGQTTGTCAPGRNPDATLQGNFSSAAANTCGPNCPTRTISAYSCNPNNTTCSAQSPCSVTANVKCACGVGSCDSNQCCCTSNGTCQPSVGGSGNCRSGFAGC